jgi:hypothetical protein
MSFKHYRQSIMSWRHYERSSNLLLSYIPKLIHTKKTTLYQQEKQKNNLALEVPVSIAVSTLFWSCYGVWLHFCCSWSEWRMFLRELVTPTVFVCCFRIRGGGRVRSAAGRSLENRLHSVIRWRAVCTTFWWQLQVGEGVFFILWRYDWKLPWLVRNCGKM